MKHKKILDYTGRAIVMCGLFMIAGGLGHIDMAAELGERLSGVQTAVSYLVSVSGFGVCFAGYKMIQVSGS